TAAKAAGAGDRTAARQPVPADRTGEIPASPMQAQLLYVESVERRPLYNEPATILFHDLVDRRALRHALRPVQKRHEALRTSFARSPTGYRQVIHPFDDADPLVSFHDLRSLPTHEQEKTARSLAGADLRMAFDVGKSPLFRARLIRTEEQQDRL